jgi:hypothetical protein
MVLVALLGAAAIAGLSSASAAMTRQQVCSTKGLSFSYKSGGATFGNKVSNLKAIGTSCATARQVATDAATKLLHRKSSPTTIDGFALHVKSPCSGCTPVWLVTATKGSSKTTFDVLGGA